MGTTNEDIIKGISFEDLRAERDRLVVQLKELIDQRNEAFRQADDLKSQLMKLRPELQQEERKRLLAERDEALNRMDEARREVGRLERRLEDVKREVSFESLLTMVGRTSDVKDVLDSFYDRCGVRRSLDTIQAVADLVDAIRREEATSKEERRPSTSFEEAWKAKEREGYQYGEEALQNVRFGWDIRSAWEATVGIELLLSRALQDKRDLLANLTAAQERGSTLHAEKVALKNRLAEIEPLVQLSEAVVRNNATTAELLAFVKEVYVQTTSVKEAILGRMADRVAIVACSELHEWVRRLADKAEKLLEKTVGDDVVVHNVKREGDTT